MNLHSTMYLLNLKWIWETTQRLTFTFHYVSIKSPDKDTSKNTATRFTFHYVSIKSTIHIEYHICLLEFTFHYVSIKSDFTLDDYNYLKIFTFHYVSIKSKSIDTNYMEWCYLHSTMYLLNPISAKFLLSPVPDLHSTMYLLNRWCVRWWTSSKSWFTFHYVSIKSGYSIWH